MVMIDCANGRRYPSDIDAERLARMQAIPPVADSQDVIDWHDNFQVMMDRLNTLISDPTATDTNIEVRQAVIDLARMQKRLLLFLKAKINSA